MKSIEQRRDEYLAEQSKPEVKAANDLATIKRIISLLIVAAVLYWVATTFLGVDFSIDMDHIRENS